MRKFIPVVCVALLATLVAAPAARAVELHPFFFTVEPSETLPLSGGAPGDEVTINPEDIGCFDGEGGYSLFFDGEEDGGFVEDDGELPEIDAISFIDPVIVQAPSLIAMSFEEEVDDLDIDGTPTDVDDSDIVLFAAGLLFDGPCPEVDGGVFIAHLEGSSIALRSSAEDIDALDIFITGVDETVVTGVLALSTTGSFTAHTATGPTVRGRDEDILRCDFTADLAEVSLSGLDDSCTLLSVAFDGSDSGLGSDTEDVDAIALEFGVEDPDDIVAYGSTSGSYKVEGDSGRDEDVFTCLEDDGAGADFCDPPGVEFVEFFDGSDWELDGDLEGFEVFDFEVPEP